MKPTDIQKIRKFLRERIAISKRAHPKSNCLIDFTYKDAEAILALLPCETCSGTGQVITPHSRGYGTANVIKEACPDCTPKDPKCT